MRNVTPLLVWTRLADFVHHERRAVQHALLQNCRFLRTIEALREHMRRGGIEEAVRRAVREELKESGIKRAASR